MAYLTLQSQVLTPNWTYGGTTAYLYIWASQAFFEATTGEFIAQGQVNNLSSFAQKITCTVSGTTVTIPEVTLATTTDSTVENVTYTAILATSANRLVYPMLSNFFVDPEYFQSPPFSAVIVADAGTPSQNGTYTYRGQQAGYPYYNLLGEADSTTLLAIVNDGSEWLNTNSLGVTQYVSASQSDYPFEELWEVSGGSADAPTVSESSQYVSGTWEQLTLSNQGVSAIPPQWPGPFWNIPQTKEYVNSLVGDGTTPFASRTVIGKTELSTNPVLSTVPIAVGDNDARVNTINVAQYSSFSAAVDAVAALTGTNILEITTSISTTAKSVPADVIVQFANGGKLTCTSGVVTILGEIRAPAQLCFVASGGTFNIASATASAFYFEWYGITSGADNTTSIQWLLDQRNGTWPNDYTTLIQLVAGTTYSFASPISFNNTQGMELRGSGNALVNNSILKYTGTGGTTAIGFKSVYGFACSGVTFSYSAVGFTGYLIEGGFTGGGGDGLYTNQVSFDQCTFTGSTTAFLATSLVQLDSFNWSFRNCRFYYSQKALTGETLLTGFGYVIDVQDCTFANNGIHLYNISQSWEIHNNTFEPVFNVGGVGPSYLQGENRVLSGDAGRFMWNFVFANNWIGDNSATASTYAGLNLIGALGAVIQGNLCVWNQAAGSGGLITAIRMENCDGVVIQGNYIQADRAFEYDDEYSYNIAIQNNAMHATVNTPVVLNSYDPIGVNYFSNTSIVNVASNGLAIGGGLEPSDTFGNIDFGGFKTELGAGNRSAQLAVLSNVSGQTTGTLAIIAPYASTNPPVGFFTNVLTQKTFVDADVNVSTNTITIASHGLITGDAVELTTTGTLPVPLATGTIYYIYKVSANSLKFCATYEEANTATAIDITSASGGGTHTLNYGVPTLRGSIGVSGLDVTVPVRPSTNDGVALGDTTHNWSDLFLASGSLINIANGNWVATHSSGILNVTTGDLRVTTAGTNSASVVTVGGTQTLTNKTLTNPTITTGSFTSPALTTPTIGVATGTSLAVTGLLKSSGTAGIGYATGAGGAQTQLTDKSTTVVSNTITTAITMNNAALNLDTAVSFTFTNSTIAATDTVLVTHQSAGTSGSYVCNAFPGAGSAVITVRNVSTGNLSEAIVLRVTVIKSVSS